MNFYVSLINDIVEHIEYSIYENIQLSDFSSLTRISDFHFNRIFKTVTGVTPKHYIIGRKLARAAEQLRTTEKSIIDIALDLGFEYPEVFSRAFKKQFGVSPAHFRKQQLTDAGIQKVCVVERDIINYRGTLALKGNIIFFEELNLKGIMVKTNIYSNDFKQKLKTETEAFILRSAENKNFIKDKFFTVVSCGGKENGEYNVFCGREPQGEIETEDSEVFLTPEGWYADFIYSGDMFDIREVFIDDLYKWIIVKGAELNPNGIGMLNIYENSYPENNKVHILVPVKKPV